MARYSTKTSVTITVTPQVAKRIDELVKTGLFGFTRADAIERLLCRAIIDTLPLVEAAKVVSK